MHQQGPLGVDHRDAAPEGLHPARMRLDVDQRTVQRRREPAGPIRAERTAPGDQAHRRYSLASTAIEVSVVRIGRIIASWVNDASNSPSSVCTAPRM